VPVTQTTKFGYDAQGNVKSIVSPIDATHTSTKSWTYNDSGTVASETDPLTASSTFATTYTYDTNNNLQTVTVAGTSTTPNLLVKTAYFYDSAGHVGCKVQNLTIDINYPGLTCDAVNGPKKIPSATADSNLVTIYAYDTNDDLVSQTDPTGVVTAYGYDTVGNRTSVTRNYKSGVKSGVTVDDQTNVKTTFTLDAAGNVLTETDPITNRIIPATSATTSFTYDALGHVLTKVIPGDSWAPSSETISNYDELGDQVLSATCAPSASTATACISAAMNKTTTTRDPMGRAVSVTSFTAADTGAVSKPASTTTAKVKFDGAGNAWQSVSAAGVTSTSSFDGLGRVVHEASAGTWASHAYDGLGDEISTTTPASNTTTAVTTRVFNPNGTVHTQTTTDAGTTTYLYDAIGRQIGAIDAAGLTVSSTNYDALGHVTSALTTNTVTPLTGGAATTVQTIVDTAYDPDGRVTSVTLPYVSGATKTTNTTAYDPLGRVAQTTVNYISGSSDPAANLVTQNYYDAAGHLIASLDPKHIATRWVYALGGELAMTISNCTDKGGNDGTTPPADPAICAGSGTSDGSTNLRTQSSTVSGSGEIVTTQTSGTAPATVTTTTTYDGKGRVLKTVVDPASGGLKLETDYAYDSHGRLFAQASPTPDGSGKVVKIIFFDPSRGLVQKTIDNCTDTSADATWSACTGAAEDGTHNLTTTYSYDTAGHISSQTSPSHAVTSYTYDGAGRVTTTTTNNATTAYYYDAAGRKIAVATPNELLSSEGGTKSYTVTRFAYDAAGNMVGQLVNCTDSGTAAPVGDAAIMACSGKSSTWNSSTNVLTTYKYDAQGHVISMTGPSPVDNGASTARVTTDYAYGADGRTCRVIENATSAVDPTTLTCTSSVTSTTTTDVSTTYTYDKAGHLASSTQAADSASGSKTGTATTSYLYDGAGHLISQIDGANSRTTTWTYDTLGRKATETDSDTSGGSTVAWLYDAAGRMCRRVAAATGNHLPDVSGLTGPCTAKINGAAIDTRYAYDSAGNATSATDAKTGQVVSATYDAVHRPTAVTNTGGAIGTSDPGTTYAYSSLTTVGRTDPSGSYAFTLDAYGREIAMSNPIGSTGSHSYTWTYGPSGALIGQSEPLGAAGTTDLTITNAYDAIGRLASKTTGTVTGPTIDAQSYTYNAAGAELSGADTLTGNPMGANGTSTYGYDALGRLASAAVPTQPSQAYTWNATADRSSVQSGSSQPVTTYYNVASQPFSDSTGGSYQSDKEGRLTAQPGQRLIWDNLGRLTEVDGSGGSVTTYSYDPLDRLAAVVNNGVTTKYFYVGLTTTIAKTIISTGSTTSTTTHLTDAAGTELAQITDTSGPVYLGRNGHGDVTSTVNATGSVVSAAQYDPFGKLTSSYGTPPANRWQGSLFEPNSGLYYVIARWYSPTLGRFLSVDPLVGSTARPQSLDRYAYVAGNPLGGVDPRGTCTWDTISMSCKDSSGVDQSSFQSNLAAATTVPFNKCLATNFHADGCTSTSTAWVETVSSTVCTQTNNYASSCTVYHSASRDLIDATDQIVAAVKIEEERVASEEKRYEAREAFYPKPPLPLPVVTPTRTPCSWWPQDGDSCESQIAGGLGNLAGDAADPIVSHIWPATGGAAVNWAAGVMESKLFPSLGQTSGLCFGGAYAVAASIGFSFCIVHDGEGYWAGLINKNVGDSPAIDASWTGSYFESTANSYHDLVGASTDYMVSGGEVVSGGVDLDWGTGRDGKPVYSLTGSAGGGFTLGIPVTVSRMYTQPVCENLGSFSKTWDCMMATKLW
jgi:RHS repeat-associated protein